MRTHISDQKLLVALLPVAVRKDLNVGRRHSNAVLGGDVVLRAYMSVIQERWGKSGDDVVVVRDAVVAAGLSGYVVAQGR